MQKYLHCKIQKADGSAGGVRNQKLSMGDDNSPVDSYEQFFIHWISERDIQLKSRHAL